jgi:general secretion pathway protein N
MTPAATVVPLLKIPERTAHIEGISGTIWTGSADRVTVNKQVISDVNWSLNPFSLFGAAIQSDISATLMSVPVTSQLNYSLLSQQTTITDLQGAVNASEVQQAINLPFGVLEGRISFHVTQLQLAGNQLENLQAQLNWNNAKLTLADTVSFGNLNLQLMSTDKGNVEGQLSNSSGDLSIDGQINIAKNQRFEFNASLTPRSNAPKELLNILNLLAPQKSGNAHVLRRQGHLRQLGITL